MRVFLAYCPTRRVERLTTSIRLLHARGQLPTPIFALGEVQMGIPVAENEQANVNLRVGIR